MNKNDSNASNECFNIHPQELSFHLMSTNEFYSLYKRFNSPDPLLPNIKIDPFLPHLTIYIQNNNRIVPNNILNNGKMAKNLDFFYLFSKKNAEKLHVIDNNSKFP